MAACCRRSARNENKRARNHSGHIDPAHAEGICEAQKQSFTEQSM